MKKFLGLMLFVVALAVSIQTAKANEPIFGFIYKNTTEAGSGFSNAAVSKKGTATCRSFFGVVGLGNCSINEAAKEGKIKNVTYYDVHTRNIIGFKTVTVNVYGN